MAVYTYTTFDLARDALFANSRFDKATIIRIHNTANKIKTNTLDQAYLQRQYYAIQQTGNFFSKCLNYPAKLQEVCEHYATLEQLITKNLKNRIEKEIRCYEHGVLSMDEILESFLNLGTEYNSCIRRDARIDYFIIKID